MRITNDPIVISSLNCLDVGYATIFHFQEDLFRRIHKVVELVITLRLIDLNELPELYVPIRACRDHIFAIQEHHLDLTIMAGFLCTLTQNAFDNVTLPQNHSSVLCTAKNLTISQLEESIDIR